MVSPSDVASWQNGGANTFLNYQFRSGLNRMRKSERLNIAVIVYQTATVLVSETTLAVKFDDGEVRVIRRTTPLCVASKASGRGPLPQFPRPPAAHQLPDMRRGSVVRSQIRRTLLGSV